VYKLCSELDDALSALLADLKERKLLDRTFIVCMGEFGRTPGDLTVNKGREHYAKATVAAFAGAGVRGGRAIGATDEQASKVVDFGWRRKRPIYMEDAAATIYSVLGVDWTKRITNTPSGREFVYVDPAGPLGVINFQPVDALFG
jgi:arylsulfatase A-like enzyme